MLAPSPMTLPDFSQPGNDYLPHWFVAPAPRHRAEPGKAAQAQVAGDQASAAEVAPVTSGFGTPFRRGCAAAFAGQGHCTMR
jgi:hypothetical protein